MYAGLIAQFSRDCCRRIAAGEALADADFQAFRTLLAARELDGRRLLGTMAGPDPSFDTVTGRCGLRPLFPELMCLPHAHREADAGVAGAGHREGRSNLTGPC